MPRHTARGPGGRFRKKGGPVGGAPGGGGAPPSPSPGPPPINIRIRHRHRHYHYHAPPPAALPAPSPPTPPPAAAPPSRGPYFGAAVTVKPRGPGSPGLIAVLLLILLVLVEWKGFFGVYLALVLGISPGSLGVTGSPLEKGAVQAGKVTSPMVILGALIFIAIASGLASIDDAWTGTMLVFVFGLWLVYLVFNPEPVGTFLRAVTPR